MSPREYVNTRVYLCMQICVAHTHTFTHTYADMFGAYTHMYVWHMRTHTHICMQLYVAPTHTYPHTHICVAQNCGDESRTISWFVCVCMYEYLNMCINLSVGNVLSIYVHVSTVCVCVCV